MSIDEVAETINLAGMQTRCSCCAGTRWLEEPSGTTHAYRVECMKCRKFIKWGAQIELDAMIDAEAEGEVVTYAERFAAPPDPFARFMSDPK